MLALLEQPFRYCDDITGVKFDIGTEIAVREYVVQFYWYNLGLFGLGIRFRIPLGLGFEIKLAMDLGTIGRGEFIHTAGF